MYFHYQHKRNPEEVHYFKKSSFSKQIYENYLRISCIHLFVVSEHEYLYNIQLSRLVIDRHDIHIYLKKKSKNNETYSYENQFGVLMEDILPGGGTRKKFFMRIE